MSVATLKYLHLVEDNKYAIAKILRKGNICEIKRCTNGLKVSEVKKTVVRK